MSAGSSARFRCIDPLFASIERKARLCPRIRCASFRRIRSANRSTAASTGAHIAASFFRTRSCPTVSGLLLNPPPNVDWLIPGSRVPALSMERELVEMSGRAVKAIKVSKLDLPNYGVSGQLVKHVEQ